MPSRPEDAPHGRGPDVRLVCATMVWSRTELSAQIYFVGPTAEVNMTRFEWLYERASCGHTSRGRHDLQSTKVRRRAHGRHYLIHSCAGRRTGAGALARLTAWVWTSWSEDGA